MLLQTCTARPPFIQAEHYWLTVPFEGRRPCVAGLLENTLVWRGLGWLCLVIVSLWLITVLFPTPAGPNERTSKDHTVGNAYEEDTPP
jgi:hypothetical protein